MKKVLLFAGTLFGLFLIAKEAVIVVSEASLMKEPDFLGEKLSVLKKGTGVLVQSEQEGWYKVKVNDKTGFLHKSAFGSGKQSLLALKAGSKSPSEREVALAAKGFSEANESKIRGSVGFNFNDLDWVVGQSVELDRIKSFAREGGLK